MNKTIQNYYTESLAIKEYMLEKLDIENGQKILEPCGGTGEFIDSILATNKKTSIDTFDINKDDILTLNQKYGKLSNVNIKEDNTLTSEVLDEYEISKNNKYDRIIGNPPYGGWISYDDRKMLREKYGNLYVKETYLLFLIRSLSVLKNEGKLTFIIPDTFLYLNSYKKIRDFILSISKIEEILLFPSNFFTGIHFGYSKLCIITLKKSNNRNSCLSNTFKIVQDFKNTDQFKKIETDKTLKIFYKKQRDVLNSPNSSFILNSNIEMIIEKTLYTLSNFADCVTGIYTGDNKKYLALLSTENVRGTKGYEVISEKQVDFNCTNVNGITTEKKYVPIVKGNPDNMYTRSNQWVIKWRPEEINFYQTNKKSRFQNANFYFQRGIAVPMVKSKKIKATEMKNMVFDQSIVGIFPFDEQYYQYLLALLNSSIINEIIHVINPTANNSANYLKRIPIKLPRKKGELSEINKLVDILLQEPNKQDVYNRLDGIINYIYKD